MSEFRIAAILNKTFLVIRRNVFAFSAITVITYIPLIVIASFDPTGGEGRTIWSTATDFMSSLCYYLLAAALTFGTIQDLHGSRAGFGSCLGEGLKRMLPVLGVSVATNIAVTIGIIALIVPGIFLFVTLYFAAPIAVVERGGVAASLRRSFALTEGYRWQVFGLLLVLVVLCGGLFIGGIATIGLTVDYVTSNDPAAESAVLLFGVGLIAIFIAVLMILLAPMILATAAAVGYHDLRIAKEGIDTSELAAVFE